MAGSPRDDGDMANDMLDITSQENVSSRSQVTRQASKQQVRHRASVACASCRDRRIRCVVPKGESECTQCKRAGTDCVIKNDDERRRPISKAYMSSLSERIQMLEGMLASKGVVPPPAEHPPKTRQEPAEKNSEERTYQPASNTTSRPQRQQSMAAPSPPPRTQADNPSPPDSAGHNAHEEFGLMTESDLADSILVHGQAFQPFMKEPSPFRNLDPKKEDIVHRLLSTKGNLSFDQLSGRLRYFGATANSHVYAECLDSNNCQEPPEQVRRSERIIRSLTPSSHEYLMSCFWDHYNVIMPVVDRDAFEADRHTQSPRFYSSFLHITILAMGYRFADRDREDMRRITLGNRESSLHREAKYMLDIELERPGGIPSVQALLLLGDLECGVGRDNTGWMYSGMANRLAFDIGLNMDCQNQGIQENEIRIRHMVMKAAVVFDKYWALFLGRPTSIKPQDLGMEILTKRFSLMSSGPSSGSGSGSGTSPAKDSATAKSKMNNAEIYEYLIELMELAAKIVEHRNNNNSNSVADQNNIFALNETEENAYLHVISVDRQLQNWYRRLPDHLTWKPVNIKAAPFSYFLLHQQYHVSMILLHRPWAKYGASVNDGASTNSHPSPSSPNNRRESMSNNQRAGSISSAGGAGNHPHWLGLGDPQFSVDDSRTSLSRSICTQQAIRVARIFWQHRQRFDGRLICVTGIQHAGTAAIALIAALAYGTSDADRRSYLGYLEILSGALTDMSHTYQPAARMDELLKAVLHQMRSDLAAPNGVPQQHPSSLGLSNGPAGFGSAGSAGSWHGHQTLPAHQQRSPSDVYSVLPARRGVPDDGDEIGSAIHKKMRPTPSRRASEFARPTPAFFGHSQPTPPSSAGGYGMHPHHPHAHHDFGSNLMGGGMFGTTPGGSGGEFNMDFLSGSAIDMDGDEHQPGMRPQGSADDYVLVTPQADGWHLPGMPDQAAHHPGYDLPISEWMDPALTASTGSLIKPPPPAASAGEGKGPAGEPGGEKSAANCGTENGDGEKSAKAAGDKSITVTGGGGAMEWMATSGAEDGMNAMSPVSLSGLVQSVEKATAQGAGRESHELDFFSF